MEDIKIETFKNITENLETDEASNLLEQFINNYPDVFTNVIDNLEPIHLYQLCKTSKGGLNKLCTQLKEQNNIIHNGISNVDYEDQFGLLAMNIKGKLYFISNELTYNGKKYDKNESILLNIGVSVFSVCLCFFDDVSLCYILDIYGILWSFEFAVKNDVLIIDSLIKEQGSNIYQ